MELKANVSKYINGIKSKRFNVMGVFGSCFQIIIFSF